MAILFRNSFDIKIHWEMIDSYGNFIILDITIQEYRLTLVGIYGPNEDKPDFLPNFKWKNGLFENSSVIMAGDWNVLLG